MSTAPGALDLDVRAITGQHHPDGAPHVLDTVLVIVQTHPPIFVAAY